MADGDQALAQSDGHTHEVACLNCATPLIGPHCHVCGQAAHVHRTLGAFWHDLLHGVLHFEGKIWRTLPLLLWRPGELTRRYIHGQRARFVSPIALFLFSVFVMFAAVNLLGSPLTINRSGDPAVQARLDRQLAEARADAAAEVAELREQRSVLVRNGQPTAAVDRQIASVGTALEAQEQLLGSGTGNGSESPMDVDTSGLEGSAGWFDAAYRKAKENPKLLFYKLQSNAYKFSWALIPISVPFVWLLFLHRRRYRQYGAYDHTVFVTYSLAFASLLWVAFLVLDRTFIPNRLLGVALLLAPPVHMYRQLRGAYELPRTSALWRTAALLVFALLASGIFAGLLLLLGVLG